MQIESTHTEVNKSVKEIYNYLMDMNNVEKLLPSGKFTNWEGNYDTCSFKMQGFGLSLEKDSSTPHSEIKLASGKDSPLDFDLEITLIELEENKTEVYLICDARVNAFLKLMIEKPLKSLFSHMSEKLGRVEIS
jgi:hypothetical protein